MATKAPAIVQSFPEDSLESIAYSVVADLETQEPNDRNRLGYHIWAWLKEGRGTLEQAIKIAGTRSTLDNDKIFALVSQRLREKGIRIDEVET